ncbi:hypothetical protein FRB91_003241 [Serendipita sp. 411]|nr:hypothetical protein FRB91_003241 [Serendipita sp. 411]
MENKKKKPETEKPIHQHLPQQLDRRHFPENPYAVYNNKATRADEEFLDDCNESMDSLLVFAGLFSAVTTGFIIETYKGLTAESTDRIEQLLGSILLRMGNSSAPYHVEDIPSKAFNSRPQIIVTNSLLFLSLTFSLISALLAILVKQWTRRIFLGLKSIPSKRDRAREHFFRMEGVKRWNLSNLIAAIPMLLHLALFFFFTGILFWLSPQNETIWVVVLIAAGLGLILYIAGAITPCIWHDSPYVWPFSTFLAQTFQLSIRFMGCVNQVLQRLKESDEATIPLPLHDSPNHSTRQKQPVLYTYINRENLDWTEDLSSPLDKLDVQIVSGLLEDAHAPISIEAALEVIRRGLCGDPVVRQEMNALQGPLLTHLLGRATDALFSCRSYDQGRLDIRFGASLDRATFIMQFFEVSLETIDFDIEGRGSHMPPLLEMAQQLMERAIDVNSLDEVCLHASVVARIQIKLGDFSHLDHVPKILQTMRLLGPAPGNLGVDPETSPWSGQEIEKYQGAISAYFIALTRLVIQRYPYTVQSPQSARTSYEPQSVDQSMKRLTDQAQTVLVLGRFPSLLLRQADNYVLLRELFGELWVTLNPCSPETLYWMKKLAMPLNWVLDVAADGVHSLSPAKVMSKQTAA